jgi:hypothetical protein
MLDNVPFDEFKLYQQKVPSMVYAWKADREITANGGIHTIPEGTYLVQKSADEITLVTEADFEKVYEPVLMSYVEPVKELEESVDG